MTLDQILAELKSAERITTSDALAASMKARGRNLDAQARAKGDYDSENPGGLAYFARVAPIVERQTPLVPASLKALVERANLQWDDRYAGRDVAYWASDERVDRAGDIVRQNWIFTDYEKNPLVQYCHDWDSPPVGNGIEYEVRHRAEKDYNGPALWFRALYALGEQNPQAESVFNLVRAGFLRACSVGFFAEVVIDVKDPAERQRLGLGRYGYVLDQNRLVENSPVPVPANTGAHVVSLLSAAKASNRLAARDLDVAREIVRRRAIAEAVDGAKWRSEDGTFLAMARMLFPSHEFHESKDLEQPIVAEDRPVGGVVAPGAVQTSAPPADGDAHAAGNDDGHDKAAARMDALEQQLCRIEATLGELTTGVSVVLQDVRGLLESIAEKMGVEAPGDDEEEHRERSGDDGAEESASLFDAVAGLHENIGRASNATA